MAGRATGLTAAAAVLAASAAAQLGGAQAGGARGDAALAIETLVETLPGEWPTASSEPEAGLADVRVPPQPLAETARGGEIIYTVTFTNAARHALHEVRISAGIPPGTTYVAGTATAPGARVLYSVDGGLRFAPPEELVVADAPDAERPAQPADYTHVRWILRVPLEPGTKGSARFRAVPDSSL